MRHISKNTNNDHDPYEWYFFKPFSQDEHGEKKDNGDNECGHVEVLKDKVEDGERTRIKLFF